MEVKIRAVSLGPEGPTIVQRALRQPGPDEIVMRVQRFSLNAGECHPPAAPRFNGWDVAGVVEQAANAGGPPVGARVVGFCRAREGWAERVVMPISDVAALPDEVSVEVAAALPVAAGTALATIDAAGGGLLGSKVLVSGVTGGVGGFATQLARAAGCHVTALVRRSEQVAYAEGLGAHEVVVTTDGSELAGHGPFRLVSTAVGGSLLTASLACLSHDGVAVIYASAGGGEAHFGSLIGKGRATLRGVNLYAVSQVEPPSHWLARLLHLVVAGKLAAEVVDLGSWETLASGIEKLRSRGYHGKGIVSVG
ncbi:MAG: zinc-binding dehydrogenase [Myxococcales bacterium]|nr:zinc-binding dehydrogenase [Myxococcales bacterium]